MTLLGNGSLFFLFVNQEKQITMSQVPGLGQWPTDPSLHYFTTNIKLSKMPLGHVPMVMKIILSEISLITSDRQLKILHPDLYSCCRIQILNLDTRSLFFYFAYRHRPLWRSVVILSHVTVSIHEPGGRRGDRRPHRISVVF